MQNVIRIWGLGSQSISYFLGAAMLLLAGAVLFTATDINTVFDWLLNVFGVSFLVLLTILSLIAVYSWVNLINNSNRDLWMHIGLHAANGVSTLALTYTLLGISLGIGTLAEQDLTPETVRVIIRGLTEHFSMAFMTTVVGLPVSALLRALLLITNAIPAASKGD
jgi:hypothetical protein